MLVPKGKNVCKEQAYTWTTGGKRWGVLLMIQMFPLQDLMQFYCIMLTTGTLFLMSVDVYLLFAYILAQGNHEFLNSLSWKNIPVGLDWPKVKNIVTNICKNICSFSAFFHWHFPTGSVTDQSSKSVCHWASGERKQTLSSVDQKTPIHFDASLAVCLIPSRLESQTHLTLLATRAKQSQTLHPTQARKPLLIWLCRFLSWEHGRYLANKTPNGFPSPCALMMIEEQWKLPGDWWNCLVGCETPDILQPRCTSCWSAPKHSSSPEAAAASSFLCNTATHSIDQDSIHGHKTSTACT